MTSAGGKKRRERKEKRIVYTALIVWGSCARYRKPDRVRVEKKPRTLFSRIGCRSFFLSPWARIVFHPGFFVVSNTAARSVSRRAAAFFSLSDCLDKRNIKNDREHIFVVCGIEATYMAEKLSLSLHKVVEFFPKSRINHTY